MYFSDFFRFRRNKKTLRECGSRRVAPSFLGPLIRISAQIYFPVDALNFCKAGLLARGSIYSFAPSHLIRTKQWYYANFVPVYSGGTAPDSNGIPY